MSLFEDYLRLKRQSMTPKQRQKNKSVNLKGRKWLYPHAIERKYATAITKELQQLTRFTLQTLKERLPIWVKQFQRDRRDAFSDEWPTLLAILKSRQRQIDRDFDPNNPTGLLFSLSRDTSEYNKEQFDKFSNFAIGTAFDVDEPQVQGIINLWAQTNHSLITSLTDEYITKVNRVVSEAVQAGFTAEETYNQVLKISKNITNARARLIARDQIGKLNGLLSQNRMQDAGIDFYIWNTAQDERVRGMSPGLYPNAVPSHWEMQGRLCRWDDSTVYSSDMGETWKPRTGIMPQVHPGSAVNCRCSSLPFFDEMIDTIDKSLLK